MTLSSLIERLEKAEGPDRELDADIAAAVLGGEIQWQTAMTGDALPVRKYPSKDHIRGFGREPVQRYTSSIDAALTLVPEGFKWKTGYSRHVPHNAVIQDYRANPILGAFTGECDSNRAIAICIASLRARSAMTGEGQS